MEQEQYKKQFEELEAEGAIKYSTARFKKKQFLTKADASFLIAKQHLEDHEFPDKMYWLQWAITIGYYAMLYATKAALISKEYEVKTHEAAQIALGHLFVPTEVEIEELELLDQAHRIFENDYVTYLEEAQTESNTARYKARASYTEKQATQIIENAQKFIEKIKTVLSEDN
jgi:uncharacterized protein (UPF0332 family)